ncbi:hypothetical protein FAM19031_002358, partial [Propionibacterium freudenreichii]|nr:hypothetical protein [Propionibacterium freudenreichii]MDK9361536.1 hypothetical protein [Propionibacterium freudenreichii]
GAPHALGVGAAHAGISTVITLDATTVTVIDPTTGQILSTHHMGMLKVWLTSGFMRLA